MQGKIILAKLATPTEGYSLSIMGEDSSETLLLINGNKQSYNGTVALLDIDPEILYGLNQTPVIQKNLKTHPQNMLASKEMAHKAFEHGMKASWWKININNTPVLTTMESFYNVTQRYSHKALDISLIQGKGKKCALLINLKQGHGQYLITNRWFEAESLPNVDKHIVLEDLDPYMYLE